MDLERVIEEFDRSNETKWIDIDPDDRVRFALDFFEKQARSALDSLIVAVYSPDDSAMSVQHAVNHVKQIFNYY